MVDMESQLKLMKKEMKWKDNLEWLHKYNKEQLDFILSPLCNQKLFGIPGGGKTRSIIGKILWMNELSIINNKKEALVVTFTRSARSDFIKKGEEININLFGKENIRTFHSLATVLAGFNRDLSMDTLIARTVNLVKKDLANMSSIDSCKVIFVDEAQDISGIQYDLVKEIADKLKVPIIMVGDPNQNIMQHQNGSDRYLISHEGTSYNLVKNYRSTQNLVRFINEFRPIDDIPKMISTRGESLNPIIFHGSMDEIINDIMEDILTSNINLEDIAVIGPVKRARPNNTGNYLSIGLQLIVNEFYDLGIKFVQYYSLDNQEDMQRLDKKKKKDHINIMTIHSAKGLEFKKVLLLNFHHSTYSRLPTEEDYNKFRYLWYVGLSRARDEMVMYVNAKNKCWMDLRECPREYYNGKGRPIYFGNYSFGKDNEEIISVTELINNKNKMNEKDFLFLEKILECKLETEEVYERPKIEIFEHEKYAALYGILMENVFEYYYCRHKKDKKQYVDRLRKRITNIIEVPKEFAKSFINVKRLLHDMGSVTVRIWLSIEHRIKRDDRQFYGYVMDELLKTDGVFMLICQNSVYDTNFKVMLNICVKIETKKDPIKFIFKVILFFYQLEHEAKYLNNMNLSKHLKSMNEYYELIKGYAKKIENVAEFQKMIVYEGLKLPLKGKLDMIMETGKIVEIKFVKEVTIKHITQLLHYYNLRYPDWNHDIDLDILNLHNGKRHKVIIGDKINKEILNKFIRVSIEKKEVDSSLFDDFIDDSGDELDGYEFVEYASLPKKHYKIVYDLETTGRICGGGYPGITQIAMKEYNTDKLIFEGFVNCEMMIPSEITRLTGIEYTDMGGAPKVDDLRKIMKMLFSDCKNITMVAHNGNRFDHKIMRHYEIFDNSLTINWLDSMSLIREKAKGLKSYSLANLYKHFFGKEIKNAHTALADVNATIAVMKKVGVKLKEKKKCTIFDMLSAKKRNN